MSATAVVTTVENRDAAAADGFQLVTETKFMQQYRTAAAVHGGSNIITVKKRSGQIEIFTVGSEGAVWNFYPDPASETGYRSVKTGLQPTVGAINIAAGLDADGRIIVFAANGLTLTYITQTDQPGPARWSAVQGIALPAEGVQYLPIESILCVSVPDGLHVCALRLYSYGGFLHRDACFSIWLHGPAEFTTANLFDIGPRYVWSDLTSDLPEFVVFDRSCRGYSGNTVRLYGQLPGYPNFKYPGDVTTHRDRIDPTILRNFFTIMADGNIAEYSTRAGPYNWNTITSKMAFVSFVSVTDATGGTHLFAVSTTGRLWHIADTMDYGVWQEPVPLRDNVARVAACADDLGAIELYLACTGRNDSLVRMVRDNATGDWRTEKIEVPSSTEVEEFIAYATDVTVQDANGTPQPGTKVAISASSVVEIVANGSVYMVGPNKPVTLLTNLAGTIALAQPTDSLGVATLSFRFPSTPSAQPIAVRQFAGVEDRLAKVTRDELLKAKDASGAYLLPDTYRNPGSAEALASNCRACMTLVGSTQVRLNTSGLHARARKLGVGTHTRANTEYLNAIVVPAEPVHWQLEFGTGTVVYRELTEEAAHCEVLNLLATHQRVQGQLSFLSELGDLITAVANGIGRVTSAVITATGNAVRAVVTFVIDGVSYIINSAVTLVEQVFELVEVAFANVNVDFKKAFEWLGFVFNWDDILRTRTVIAYTIEEFLAFLSGAAIGIRTRVDNEIANLEAQIDPIFNDLINKLGGGTLGGTFQSNEKSDPVFSAGFANNQILDETLANGGTASGLSGAAITRAVSGAADDFMKKLQDFVASVGADDDFKRALEIFEHLSGDLNQILRSLGAAFLNLMKGIAKVVLRGARLVIDGLFELVSALIDATLAALKAEIQIPFVSTFYVWLAHAKLTPLDLIALIAAIPTTVLYKAVTGAAPFPDPASIDQFKASYTSQAMFSLSGLGPARGLVGASAGAPLELPLKYRQLLAIASIACNWGYGFVSMVPDVSAATDGHGGVAEGAVMIASLLGFGLEIGGQALSFPWFMSNGGPDCSSADGVGKWLWIHGCAGVLLDGYFIRQDLTFPENNNTVVGPMVALGYGVSRLCVYSIGFPKLNLNSRISYGVEAALNCLKILRLPALGTKQVLTVLGVFDFVGASAIGVASFLDPPKTAEGPAASVHLIPGAVPHAVW